MFIELKTQHTSSSSYSFALYHVSENGIFALRTAFLESSPPATGVKGVPWKRVPLKPVVV